jgi:ATP-dependent Clp protease protease subunit
MVGIKLVMGGTSMDESELVIGITEELFNVKLPNSYLLKYYEDLEHRTFWISDEINDDLMYELSHYIIKWNREDKDVPEMDRKPIYLLINCQGGDLDAYASICSMIELSKTPIIGVAMGLVASAASLIYLSCHARLALKSSYFILHKGSAALSGDFDNIMNSIDDYKREVEKMANHILEHSNYTREEVESHIGRDWYIRAPEALEKGLVDQIITDINILL